MEHAGWLWKRGSSGWSQRYAQLRGSELAFFADPESVAAAPRAVVQLRGAGLYVAEHSRWGRAYFELRTAPPARLKWPLACASEADCREWLAAIAAAIAAADATTEVSAPAPAPQPVMTATLRLQPLRQAAAEAAAVRAAPGLAPLPPPPGAGTGAATSAPLSPLAAAAAAASAMTADSHPPAATSLPLLTTAARPSTATDPPSARSAGDAPLRRRSRTRAAHAHSAGIDGASGAADGEAGTLPPLPPPGVHALPSFRLAAVGDHSGGHSQGTGSAPPSSFHGAPESWHDDAAGNAPPEAAASDSLSPDRRVLITTTIVRSPAADAPGRWLLTREDAWTSPQRVDAPSAVAARAATPRREPAALLAAPHSSPQSGGTLPLRDGGYAAVTPDRGRVAAAARDRARATPYAALAAAAASSRGRPAIATSATPEPRVERRLGGAAAAGTRASGATDAPEYIPLRQTRSPLSPYEVYARRARMGGLSGGSDAGVRPSGRQSATSPPSTIPLPHPPRSLPFSPTAASPHMQLDTALQGASDGIRPVSPLFAPSDSSDEVAPSRVASLAEPYHDHAPDQQQQQQWMLHVAAVAAAEGERVRMALADSSSSWTLAANAAWLHGDATAGDGLDATASSREVPLQVQVGVPASPASPATTPSDAHPLVSPAVPAGDPLLMSPLTSPAPRRLVQHALQAGHDADGSGTGAAIDIDDNEMRAVVRALAAAPHSASHGTVADDEGDGHAHHTLHDAGVVVDVRRLASALAAALREADAAAVPAPARLTPPRKSAASPTPAPFLTPTPPAAAAHSGVEALVAPITLLQSSELQEIRQLLVAAMRQIADTQSHVAALAHALAQAAAVDPAGEALPPAAVASVSWPPPPVPLTSPPPTVSLQALRQAIFSPTSLLAHAGTRLRSHLPRGGHTRRDAPLPAAEVEPPALIDGEQRAVDVPELPRGSGTDAATDGAWPLPPALADAAATWSEPAAGGVEEPIAEAIFPLAYVDAEADWGLEDEGSGTAVEAAVPPEATRVDDETRHLDAGAAGFRALIPSPTTLLRGNKRLALRRVGDVGGASIPPVIATPLDAPATSPSLTAIDSPALGDGDVPLASPPAREDAAAPSPAIEPPPLPPTPPISESESHAAPPSARSTGDGSSSVSRSHLYRLATATDNADTEISAVMPLVQREYAHPDFAATIRQYSPLLTSAYAAFALPSSPSAEEDGHDAAFSERGATLSPAGFVRLLNEWTMVTVADGAAAAAAASTPPPSRPPSHTSTFASPPLLEASAPAAAASLSRDDVVSIVSRVLQQTPRAIKAAFHAVPLSYAQFVAALLVTVALLVARDALDLPLPAPTSPSDTSDTSPAPSTCLLRQFLQRCLLAAPPPAPAVSDDEDDASPEAGAEAAAAAPRPRGLPSGALAAGSARLRATSSGGGRAIGPAVRHISGGEPGLRSRSSRSASFSAAAIDGVSDAPNASTVARGVSARLQLTSPSRRHSTTTSAADGAPAAAAAAGARSAGSGLHSAHSSSMVLSLLIAGEGGGDGGAAPLLSGRHRDSIMTGTHFRAIVAALASDAAAGATSTPPSTLMHLTLVQHIMHRENKSFRALFRLYSERHKPSLASAVVPPAPAPHAAAAAAAGRHKRTHPHARRGSHHRHGGGGSSGSSGGGRHSLGAPPPSTDATMVRGDGSVVSSETLEITLLDLSTMGMDLALWPDLVSHSALVRTALHVVRGTWPGDVASPPPERIAAAAGTAALSAPGSSDSGGSGAAVPWLTYPDFIETLARLALTVHYIPAAAAMEESAVGGGEVGRAAEAALIRFLVTLDARIHSRTSAKSTAATKAAAAAAASAASAAIAAGHASGGAAAAQPINVAATALLALGVSGSGGEAAGVSLMRRADGSFFRGGDGAGEAL